MSGKLFSFLFVSILASLSFAVYAEQIVVPIHLVSKAGTGKNIGTLTLSDATCGVLINPNLHDLSPGLHGFHIHVNPDCSNNGLAAGDHLDPEKTQSHLGPYSTQGHLGDLPVLIVDKKGNAILPTLAPRFTLAAIKGHAIMIHVGGDNYSDTPTKLGGGGNRIACGVIPTSA